MLGFNCVQQSHHPWQVVLSSTLLYMPLDTLQVDGVLLEHIADPRIQLYLADVRFVVIGFRQLLFEIDFA